MKILLFTPGSRKSSIAGCSDLLIQEFQAQQKDVTVVLTDDHLSDDNSRSFTANTISWRNEQEVLSNASTSDFILFQMGNNWLFHCGAIHWMQKVRGCLILHDIDLSGIGHAWEESNPLKSLEVIKALPGGKPQNFLMREWLCSLSSGIMCHSQWSLNLVKTDTLLPVVSHTLIPNKFHKDYQAILKEKSLRVDVGSEKKKILNLLIFGHINANKMALEVMSAIAQSEFLVEKCVLRLVGPITDCELRKVIRLSRTLGVSVLVFGEVDDIALEQQINLADIVLCLRMPVLEGASGSVLESLFLGKLTFVMDIAHYKEYPDNIVVKINNDSFNYDLIAHLTSYIEESAIYQNKSKAGMAWAYQSANTLSYVSALENLLSLSSKITPFLHAVDQIFCKTSAWNFGGNQQLLSSEFISGPLDIFK